MMFEEIDSLGNHYSHPSCLLPSLPPSWPRVMSEPPAKKQRSLAAATLASSAASSSRGAPLPEDCSEIYFPSSGVLRASYKLFEVPKDFSLPVGQQLRLIGDDSNHAVLCTDAKTFAIKKVETSNSVFLVAPSEDQKFTVQSMHQTYYEVRV